MCLSVPVAMSLGVSLMLLYHMAIVKYVSVYPKIILDAALDADFTAQFHGLHAHPTSVLAVLFPVEVLGKQGLCQYRRYWRGTLTSDSAN
jgi:hypothetical protein